MATQTFTITNNSSSCPITYPTSYNLTDSNIQSFKPLTQWIDKVQTSLSHQTSDPTHPFHSQPYKLLSITIQSVDWFGSRIGFMKISADIKNDAGEFLPGAIFLRGASVAMMIILTPDDEPATTEEHYVLLTIQPRMAAGSLRFVELPAGMLDDSGTFAGAAAKEIEEECGLQVREDELINISELAAAASTSVSGHVSKRSQGRQKDEGVSEAEGEESLPVGVFPSAGACDEWIPIFLCRKQVKRAELKAWEGKLTGLRDEGEKITLKLVRLQNLWREASRDAKALSALALYQGLKSENMI